MHLLYMIFTPTRASGLSRLSEFLPAAGRDYARLRNSDFGPGAHNHVSRLSPYIRRRLITEREIVKAVLAEHDAYQSEKYVQEVFWRTYFKGWLEQRPHIWTRYQSSLKASLIGLETDSALRASYERAVDGETGIDCFDAWAQELIDTGYLHNHARMWFASIWIFTLKLPWELGADMFLRRLLDADPASNTLSWRWVAGLHTKGKTYLARADNISKFTHGRFNPQGQLANFAEPMSEIEDDSPDQILPQPGVIPKDDFLLLIHEDDCHPESLLPSGVKAATIVGAIATPHLSPLALAKPALDFSQAAIGNTLERCGLKNRPLISGDWAEALIAACHQAGVTKIVTAYAPVGPSAQALQMAAAPLANAGLNVSQVLRPWDQHTWPFANRGFFKVKKKIPTILAAVEASA